VDSGPSPRTGSYCLSVIVSPAYAENPSLKRTLGSCKSAAITSATPLMQKTAVFGIAPFRASGDAAARRRRGRRDGMRLRAEPLPFVRRTAVRPAAHHGRGRSGRRLVPCIAGLLRRHLLITRSRLRLLLLFRSFGGKRTSRSALASRAPRCSSRIEHSLIIARWSRA
jgi:hypothetical protein